MKNTEARTTQYKSPYPLQGNDKPAATSKFNVAEKQANPRQNQTENEQHSSPFLWLNQWFGQSEASKGSSRQLNSAPAVALSCFNRNVEKFWDQFYSSFPFSSASNLFTNALPQVDFYETDKEYVFSAEFPGAVASDINVHAHNGLLNITSNQKKSFAKNNEAGEAVSNFLKAFESSLSLPLDSNSEEIEARFKDGKLTVTVPKLDKGLLEKSRIQVRSN